MNEQDERFVPVGKHLLRIDDDSAYLIARDVLTADDMRVLLETFDRVAKESGGLFVLYDGTKCTGIDPAARKLAALERPTQREADLQVAFGVSFAIRIIVNMLIRAQALLRTRTVNLFILNSETEALAFFETEREKIRKKLRAASSL